VNTWSYFNVGMSSAERTASTTAMQQQMLCILRRAAPR